MAFVAPPRKDEWAPPTVTSKIMEMQVVDKPQGIESRQIALKSLLPIDPPEIDAHRLIRMVQKLEIAFGKCRAGDVKRDRLFGRWVDVHAARHRLVLFLVR